MIRRLILVLVIACVIQLRSCEDSGAIEDKTDENLDDTSDPLETEASDTEQETTVAVATRKKVKKVVTSTLPPIVQSCEVLLATDMTDCFANIPEGYDSDSCSFLIINERCDWQFICQEIVTEAPQSSETSSESSESDSCEIDKEIKFENCWISINGYVKRTRN